MRYTKQNTNYLTAFSYQDEHLQEFPKHPHLEFFARLEKTHLQQLLITAPNHVALGKIDARSLVPTIVKATKLFHPAMLPLLTMPDPLHLAASHSGASSSQKLSQTWHHASFPLAQPCGRAIPHTSGWRAHIHRRDARTGHGEMERRDVEMAKREPSRHKDRYVLVFFLILICFKEYTTSLQW